MQFLTDYASVTISSSINAKWIALDSMLPITEKSPLHECASSLKIMAYQWQDINWVEVLVFDYKS